jgi:hypothetical protein
MAAFQIADRVRWEWFYYGQPKTAANFYFEEFGSSKDIAIN